MITVMPPEPKYVRVSDLSKWRRAKGWTQKELAAEIGVGVATVQRLEAMPSLPKKYQLAFDQLKDKKK
jgi:transcriptional regulator with XRE-family HTH domain